MKLAAQDRLAASDGLAARDGLAAQDRDSRVARTGCAAPRNALCTVRRPAARRIAPVALPTLLTWTAACGGGASGDPSSASGVSPETMADALHHVIESDRTVYARQVVHRLQDQEGVIMASEHWEDDVALPLPAQMFRMGAQLTADKTSAFSYALLSMWPINTQNAATTEAEVAGLQAVAADPSTPYYATETLGGMDYFTAVYADVAVSPACTTCHNAHPDSPRDDFQLNETMGGIVIRILLDG